MDGWAPLLSPPAQAVLMGTAPTPMIDMASRGLAPLPPNDLLVLLVALADRGDEPFSKQALEALTRLPPKIVETVLTELGGRELGDSAMTWVDSFLELSLTHDLDYVETLVVYPHVSSQCLETLIGRLPLSALDLIASDFRRLVATPELAFLVYSATHANAALKAKVEEWAKRQGIPLHEFIETAPPAVAIEDDDSEDIEIDVDDSDQAESSSESELPPAATAFVTDNEDDELEGSARQIPLTRLLRDMSAAQKIALALKGNREARIALIRDSNRMVSSAVLKNPRITDREILSAAQNRASSEEVIRLICSNRDAVKNYQIRHALVSHPKTPMQLAMRFMKTLRSADIKNLSKSKSIPSALVNQAKKLSKR